MKKLLNILFVMFFAFTLVSCGTDGGDTNGGGTNNGGSGDKVIVQLWHGNGADKNNLYNEMAETFEAKYPNVDIQLTAEGSYDNLLDKVKKYFEYYQKYKNDELDLNNLF